MWRACLVPTVLLGFLVCVAAANAQSRNYSSVQGTVIDPTGAVVPGATVEIRNPVSHFERTATTDNMGAFAIANVPYSSYHMTVSAPGFASTVQDVDLKSAVPINIKITL